MLTAALIAAAVALAPTYAGRTDEGRRIVIQTASGRVTLVHAAVTAYECEQFGDVGPLRVHARARATIDSRGRFELTATTAAERVTVRGTLTSSGASGTLRVRGSIATGQRCASRTLRFSAGARTPRRRPARP